MHIRHLRWRNLALLALLLSAALWPLQHLAERYFRSELAEQNRQTLDLYVANLLGILRRYEVLPGILGDLPILRDALQSPQQENVGQANQLLEQLRHKTGADVIYLMDARGSTLAASNWAINNTFINRNFSFRPYFQQAMLGGAGRFFGLGTTSGKRGYFFSAAIHQGERVMGVLVVKVDLDHTENLWGQTPEQLLVTDANGVVILTSRPEWRFRATRPLTPEEQEQITLHLPYPTPRPQPLEMNPRNWLVRSQTLPEIGWTASILAPVRQVEAPVRTVMAVGAATLVMILMWIGLLMQRRRHLFERMEIDARTRHELEQRVEERTRDLQMLNQRLKSEVLEREQAQQELVRAQDELLQTGKLSALGTMSASISHELNQPLGAIRSYADNARILLDHERQDEARANLQQISELTARMASIIAHLKNFARRDQHTPEPVSLQAALDDCLRLIDERRQRLAVELIREIPEATLWVQAGETRLRQVISNLLSNALDALADVHLPRQLCLTTLSDLDGVHLQIRDNGPGFTAEALEHARDPFFTTRASTEGLGLGLAICESITRSLGGTLKLSNHPAGGAQVELFLRHAAPGHDYPREGSL